MMAMSSTFLRNSMVFFLFSLVLLSGAVFFVRYLEKTVIFYPESELTTTPKDFDLLYEDVWFESQSLRLHGWWVAHPQSRATVLYCHGNAGNISDRASKVKAFYDLGLSVFIFDYRGYGQSEGVPTENGLYADTAAAFEILKSYQKIEQPVLIYGASLGGVPAIDLASREKVDGLIIDASFPNAYSMAQRMYSFIPEFFLAVKMPSDKKIQEVKIPKLFFHSREDDMVPFNLGQQLFDIAPEPKRFVILQGGHVDGHVDDPQNYRQALEEFLEEVL